MQHTQLLKIISNPEGQDLEFKEHTPEPDLLAKILSAFSNSDGGTVVLGIGSHGAVIGVRNLDDAMNKVARALELIKPTPEVKSSIEMVDGKAVVVLNVQKSNTAPHVVNNMLFKREGNTVAPMDAKSLQRVLGHSSTLENIDSKLVWLTQIIEKQNSQLIHAQSWHAKLLDMVLGGVIGALISFLIQFFF
jgi:ATP-dependent DNA helicase RecG